MAAALFPRLVADVGGTNARFGWIDAPQAAIAHVRTLPCADHPGLAEAVRSYLAMEQLGAPGAMAMGIATPVTGDAVRMTNHHWAFSIAALKAELGLQRLEVLNDFTALALSLPTLAPSELRQVGGGTPQPHAPRALIGPGTGLGVSGLLPHGAAWVPIAGEGGHVTLSPTNPRETAVAAQIAQRHGGHPSGERALSGAGLVTLYEALCALDGHAPVALRPSDVTERGLQEGGDPVCREALTLFCALLGTLAGNLALTLGALGGVYIGGGIVPRLGRFFDDSPFRARFEAKGRYQAYLSRIPVFVIDAPVSPALAGAALALDQD